MTFPYWPIILPTMKKFIETLLDANGKFTGGAEARCKKQHPEQYAIIMQMFPRYDSFLDKCYAIMNDGPHTCKVCGSYISFGWATRNKIYCSPECKRADKDTISDKAKQTWLAKYGVDSPAKAESVRQKMVATTRERYGVDNIMQSQEYREQHNITSPFADKSVRDKIKATNIERYGFANPLKNDDVRAKAKETLLARYGGVGLQSDIIREKVEETTLAKYGVRNVFESEEIQQKISETVSEKYGVDTIGKSDVIRAKIESTCLSRYGAASPFESEDIRLKIAQTNIEKYGVDNPLKYDEFRAKATATTQAKYGTTFYTQSDEYKKQVESKRRRYVESLGLEYRDNLLIGPTKNGMVSKECIEAQLDGTVTREMLVREFSDYHNAMRELGIRADGNITAPHKLICSILDKHGIQYETNNRQIIKPKELDIFIPDHNLAIEVNGLYWHSTNIPVADKRHLDKFMSCKDQGIKLLQFTDADIIHRRQLIESMILSKLGLLPIKIMARKYRVVNVESSDGQQFLERCHYQGRTTQAAKFVGLICDETLVAVLAYSCRNNVVRVERFACELFTNVVGGYSKLESFVIKQLKPTTLETFSLGLISDGSLYSQTGYITSGYATSPEWYVTDYKQLYNRQRFMKSKMARLFGNGFDSGKTEWENIISNGLYLYFGAGITKWVKYIITNV